MIPHSPNETCSGKRLSNPDMNLPQPGHEYYAYKATPGIFKLRITQAKFNGCTTKEVRNYIEAKRLAGAIDYI